MNVVFLFCGKAGEVGMIREYIIKISDEIMEEEIADRPQELIRCNDCNNGVIYCDNGDIICDHVDSNGNDTHPADWYCADGERRTE